MCLLWAVLGLRCCVGLSLAVASGGYSLAAGHSLLVVVASLVAKHALQGTRASVVAARGLNSWGTPASLLCSMWNLPGPGIEPMSPALAG